MFVVVGPRCAPRARGRQAAGAGHHATRSDDV